MKITKTIFNESATFFKLLYNINTNQGIYMLDKQDAKLIMASILGAILIFLAIDVIVFLLAMLVWLI